MAAHSPSRVRSATLRKSAFSLEKAFLRSSAPQRIEVWRVGRQEQQGRPCGLDSLAGLATLMRSQVVQDDGVAGAQGWTENLVDIDLESLRGHRPIEKHGRGQPG